MNTGIVASAVVVSAGTDVLNEPFNNLTAWTSTGSPSITAARTGNGLSCTGNTARVDYSLAANENEYVTIGFAWRTNTTSATQRDVCTLYSDTNTVRHVRLAYDGTTNQRFSIARDATSLGNSATGLVPVNTWCYLELQTRLHDSAGTAVVRLNGVEIINLSAVDTKNAGTKTVFDTVRLGLGSSGAGLTNLWDDLYITVGAGAAFKGDHTIP